jgi:pimeloyl-ACP methyl ester carboxylesterase
MSDANINKLLWKLIRTVIFSAFILLLTSLNSEVLGQIQWSTYPADMNEDLKERVQFGYLSVPENYDLPEGRIIKIAFAVVKATNTASEPDPVIYFQGGWGLPTLQNLSRLTDFLDIRDRDVIYFDSRGIGFSEPEMCRELGKAIFEDLKNDMQQDELYQNQLQRMNSCLDLLEERGIDYNQYGHNNSSRDALTLAEELAYEDYNLLGISNGTRHIQNFIKAAENSHVTIRSAILDSVVPMGVVKQGLLTVTYARTLNMLFDDCEESPICTNRFPNLRTRFQLFIKTLDDHPIRISMQGRNEAFTINKTELNAIIHQLLHMHQFYEVFPIFIQDLIEGNTNLLQLMMPRLEDTLVKSYGNFVSSVQYAYNDKVFNPESIEIYERSVAEMPDLEVWEGHFIFLKKENRLFTDSLEVIPVESDIPALILAGSYDPITPPEWSQLLQNRFNNAHYIEFPAHGHGVLPTPCGLELMSSFLDNPSEKPNPVCLDSVLGGKVEFITEYYANPRTGDIAMTVLGNLNIILTVSILFVILICLINIIRSIPFLFKRDKPFPMWLFIGSLLILVLLAGFSISFYNTLNQNFFLIASGLVSSVNIWFFLSPIILLFILAYSLRMLKSNTRSIWCYVSLVAFLSFAVILVHYRLFPNI